MLAIFYCEECINNLLLHGELALKVFEEVCEKFLFSDAGYEISIKKEGENNSLMGLIEFLEKKGYVISTESGEFFLRVKPSGLDCYWQSHEINCFVCARNHE